MVLDGDYILGDKTISLGSVIEMSKLQIISAREITLLLFVQSLIGDLLAFRFLSRIRSLSFIFSSSYDSKMLDSYFVVSNTIFTSLTYSY